MNKSIGDQRTRALLFRQPTENYEKAIEEISKIHVY